MFRAGPRRSGCLYVNPGIHLGKHGYDVTHLAPNLSDSVLTTSERHLVDEGQSVVKHIAPETKAMPNGRAAIHVISLVFVFSLFFVFSIVLCCVVFALVFLSLLVFPLVVLLPSYFPWFLCSGFLLLVCCFSLEFSLLFFRLVFPTFFYTFFIIFFLYRGPDPCGLGVWPLEITFCVLSNLN